MKEFCPLIKKKCVEHDCKFYIQVMGKHPQTGQDVNNFDCAISWLPVLLIEGSQQTRHTGAAIESFRNEMVNIQSDFAEVAIDQESRRKLKEGLYPPNHRSDRQREFEEYAKSTPLIDKYSVMNGKTQDSNEGQVSTKVIKEITD